MKILFCFLSIGGLLGLVLVSPVSAETEPPLSLQNSEFSPPIPPTLVGLFHSQKKLVKLK